MKDLLEVLRVQRHNFMNHLQVISGLLQLKKHDRIMDYIIQIGNEYNQDSLIGRLEVPEITVAILSWDLKAAKQGININKKITTGLERGIVQPEEIAEIFKAMLKIAAAAVENRGAQERIIGLEVTEEAAKYLFRVNFPHSGPEEFEKETDDLNTRALAVDAEMELECDSGLITMTLKIPITDNNTDK